ncbi:ATP-binding protein [Actinomadura oligospora]|uniref:ATP-binding protein n=1 Tax=Actinomadura oligospora TaxID=111804 RepID=UPI0004B60264|nr:BTAD domain-containing putative transcriptional regulator [Actinomadura oligospora]
MRFGVLGATAAWRTDGTPVPLGGPARRALLALLLVRPGEAVSAEGLADELYTGGGQAGRGGPAHALQSQVSRLRGVLRPDADIESTPAGYRLTRTDTDAARFEALAEDGRAALAAGDASRAADLLAEALGLWRGPAFADAAETASGGAAATRLDELRFAALVARAEADLALGRHDAAVAELRDLVARHPLREDLRALLMRALAAGGRQAEALTFFEETRVLLADELGADPSPELTALHRALLQGTAAAPPPAARPRPRTARPGTPISGFVGRDDDLAGVLDGLASGRLVTLFGPGGVGKTRLSGEVARRWDGEVAFAPLAPVADPAQAVLQALGLRERGLLSGGGGDPDPEERLVAALAERRLLLVLDNCEHVVGDAANLAWRLLSECPDLRILATSREPLDVAGERLWQVRPLPQDDAARLFEERARAARRDVVLDGPLVRKVCAALDDLPLAIELAAARLRTHELPDVAERLDDRFALLARGSRTADARHRTLRAVVDWSWELLTEDERAAARRFTVFAGGATAATALKVARADEETLTALADRSLLDFSQGRYRMLETIRAYGTEKLDEAGETDEFHAAHTAHLLALTADADLLGSGQLAALDRLAAEHDDLFAALRRAIGAGRVGTASRLLTAMSIYLWIRGLAGSAAPLAAAILDLEASDPSVDLPPEEYAVCVTIAGTHATDRQRERAASALAEADRPLRNSMTALQWLMNSVGGGDVSVQYRTLMAERESPDRWARAAAHLMSGYPQLAQGDLAQAEQEYQTAADGFRQLGERWGTALALDALAGLAATTGDTARAVALTDEALTLAGELGAADDLADLLCNRGDLRAADDPEAARADYAEAAAVARRAGNATCLAAALRGQADMALAKGDKDEAQRLYEEALDRFDATWVKSVGNRVRTLIGLGRIAEPAPKAADLYRQAVEVAAVIGALSEAARAVVALAHVHEGKEAARMLGAATVLRGMDAVADPDVTEIEETVREQLGDDAYTAAYREGLRLSHDEVLLLAGLSEETVQKTPLNVLPEF